MVYSALFKLASSLDDVIVERENDLKPPKKPSYGNYSEVNGKLIKRI